MMQTWESQAAADKPRDIAQPSRSNSMNSTAFILADRTNTRAYATMLSVRLSSSPITYVMWLNSAS